MATIRKRTWTNGDGSRSVRWQLSYTDAAGERHRSLHPTRTTADAERVRIEGQLASGVHVPDKDSVTVLAAGRAWVAHLDALVAAGKRERSTADQYRRHIELHLAKDHIGTVKLSRLNTPECQAFADRLDLAETRPMARNLLRSLRMLLNYSQRKGWIVGNPATAAKLAESDRDEGGADGDGDGDARIPTKDELRRLLQAAADRPDKGFALAFINLALFGGLRASELRGLRRDCLTLTGHPEVRVRQRADSWQKLGPPKSRRSRRTVPLGPHSVAALRRWLIAAPPSPLGLVFPTVTGTVQSYANIYHRVWIPLCMAAGLATKGVQFDAGGNPKVDARGRPKTVARPRYGIHALRHAAASLWIEQGLMPKQVQHRMGHTTLQMTMDLYGHLWRDPASEHQVAAATESILLG